MSDSTAAKPRLEVHVLFGCDTTLATALAAAGLRADGRLSTAEVWVTSAPDPGVNSDSDNTLGAQR